MGYVYTLSHEVNIESNHPLDGAELDEIRDATGRKTKPDQLRRR